MFHVTDETAKLGEIALKLEEEAHQAFLDLWNGKRKDRDVVFELTKKSVRAFEDWRRAVDASERA
jgi:hypothetical protein